MGDLVPATNPLSRQSDRWLFLFALNVLLLPVPLEQCDGVILKPGDDKVLIRCAELDSTIPKAGDTIQETVSDILRDVNAASSNLSRQMWTCFCRRW